MATDSCAAPLAFACDPHTTQRGLCGELLQWPVWLRTFLVEATSASNDNLLGAQESVAGARQNIKLRLAGRAFFKLSGTYQPAKFFFQ